MAAAATQGQFSASTSSFRTSQQTQNVPSSNSFSYSDSTLTQLPTVDFNFDDLRRRMAEFTVKFDAFIEKGRKRVLEERNDFRGRLGELNEEQRSASTQISTMQSTLSSHAHILSREQAEKHEMHAAIEKLETHQANQRAHKDKLKAAIAQTQRAIDAKLAAQREYADKMDGQSRLNGPELTFWETYLGARIEGAGDENVVKVVFAFPPAVKGDKGGEEREAVFELQIPDSGSGGYKVVYSKPKLDEAKTDRVVQRLNETRDIATLLKGMRALFAEEMNEKMAVR